MSSDAGTYRGDLILALRMRDIPGDRIGEIVAEVESHVADSGEDPREAFGPPQEYAASVSGRARTRWSRADVLVAVGSLVGGWSLATGLLGLMGGDPVGPLPTWALLGVAVVVLAPTLGHLRRSASPARDPRTGQDLAPLPRWVPWAMGASLALPVVLAAVVIAAAS
ncbi:hypothetical protein JKP75_17945 [Blastococcus sp. TML/M2B]|uniref:HAAS signaling domain-containing protein n=1 Tax=unclassified Blastococcus TaxID=2619396 RepID=UPI001909A4DC|nr:MULTISPECIES: hypothetical protein [unclassified Blastococcus]MBN1094265.1 hypothetical protein [Blastococcus sp. TML/M2B]MBN1095614.1 hypothetical protein [Blastococcus sp. TML/C7B]